MKVDPKFPSLDEYLVQSEPEKAARAANWAAAIGLQKVDGLETSPYLTEIAIKNIEGDIDINTADRLISEYYIEHGQSRPHTEEADKVAGRIAKLLSEAAISFTAEGFAAIHRRLFTGIFNFAGQLRQVNITKKEWVLNGDTVMYAPYTELRPTIEYEINTEKQFSYSGLNPEQIVAHIARFVASLWQIHPFREGNTRTTAVFTIKYLRSMGFNVNNALFEKNAKYFRDALARANYSNLPKSITADYTGLEHFFSNLLFGTAYELKKRYLHVDAAEKGIVDTTWGLAHPLSTPQVAPQVKALLFSIGDSEISASALRELMALKDAKHFREAYLQPAISEGYVAMTSPDKPNSNRQKYYLTVKGEVLRALLRKEGGNKE